MENESPQNDYRNIYNCVFPHNHPLSDQKYLEAERKNKIPEQGTVKCQAPATREQRKLDPGWPG